MRQAALGYCRKLVMCLLSFQTIKNSIFFFCLSGINKNCTPFFEKEQAQIKNDASKQILYDFLSIKLNLR